MTQYTYNSQIDGEHAKAVGRDMSISSKHSIEICNNLRNMNLNKAKKVLSDVVALKKAIPYKRFNKDLGHKKGMGPGRYPVKAAKEILKLILSVEANAQSKGLNTGTLGIVYLCANKASRPYKSGRQRGRLMKRTHVEIIVKEVAQKSLKSKISKKLETTSQTKEEKKRSKKETKEEKTKAKSAHKVEVKKETITETKPVKSEEVKKEEMKVEEKPKEEMKPMVDKKVELKDGLDKATKHSGLKDGLSKEPKPTQSQEKPEEKKEVKEELKEEVKKEEKMEVKPEVKKEEMKPKGDQQ